MVSEVNHCVKLAIDHHHTEIMDYLVSLVLDEMKKYMLLLLLNKTLHKDLLPIAIDKFTKYSEHYAHYQKMK